MRSRDRVQKGVYFALFAVIGTSGTLFFSQYATSTRFWEHFTFAYLLLLLVYTWYLFGLLLANDIRPRRYPAYADEKIGVLIPCFNESSELVEESIRSVLAAQGRKQVVVIDDG